MPKASILLAVTLLLPFSLFAQPIASLYDMHMQYQQVEMIELAPGIVVRADIWPDDYVPTVKDLIAVGLPYEDAIQICEQQQSTTAVPCTWGQIKMCALEGIPTLWCHVGIQGWL